MCGEPCNSGIVILNIELESAVLFSRNLFSCFDAKHLSKVGVFGKETVVFLSNLIMIA